MAIVFCLENNPAARIGLSQIGSGSRRRGAIVREHPCAEETTINHQWVKQHRSIDRHPATMEIKGIEIGLEGRSTSKHLRWPKRLDGQILLVIW